jgi:hypothetical protein
VKKLIKESLEDVLKPKQLIGKLFYIEGSFQDYPIFVRLTQFQIQIPYDYLNCFFSIGKKYLLI